MKKLLLFTLLIPIFTFAQDTISGQPKEIRVDNYGRWTIVLRLPKTEIECDMKELPEAKRDSIINTIQLLNDKSIILIGTKKTTYFKDCELLKISK